MTDALVSLESVLATADGALKQNQSSAGRVMPTGFELLDTYLSGGFRSGELVLLGGPQGLGKTTFALQVLRNMAKEGETGLYFSYEHDAPIALERLVAMEAGEAQGIEGVPLRRVRQALEASDGMSGDLTDRLAGMPGGREAVAAVREYASRLHIYRANGSTTDLGAIRSAVQEVTEQSGQAPFVVVDYLQKVPVPGGPDVEAERVTIVVEGLKDLALELGVPVFAIVAAEQAGLEAGKRLRVHHLRGTSALAYEPDIVLVLNNKFDVVARHHLVYDVGNAERFKAWVVLTIEKNRSGMDKIDVELRKRFEQARFETDGQAVEEQLVDERVFVE